MEAVVATTTGLGLLENVINDVTDQVSHSSFVGLSSGSNNLLLLSCDIPYTLVPHCGLLYVICALC